MGAADVGDAGLGEPEKARLALPDEIADGPGHILDRHGRIDAVLVQEIDLVGLEPGERSVDGFADRRRPAVAFGADLLAALDAKAELGRDRHLIAAPLSARPISSSLAKGP